MPVPFEYLKELVAFAQAHGLSHVKCGEIEFTLSPPKLIEPSKSLNSDEGFNLNEALATVSDPNIPDEDDFLFWSSGGPLPSELRKATQDNEDKHV